MQNILPNNKQLYDAIFGFAIGDALGVPYEFQERGSFLCTDLTGYGCHHQPAGTWSDDTSMTLATKISHLRNETHDFLRLQSRAQSVPRLSGGNCTSCSNE